MCRKISEHSPGCVLINFLAHTFVRHSIMYKQSQCLLPIFLSRVLSAANICAMCIRLYGTDCENKTNKCSGLGKYSSLCSATISRVLKLHTCKKNTTHLVIDQKPDTFDRIKMRASMFCELFFSTTPLRA